MKKDDNAPETLNLDSFLTRTVHTNKDLMQNLKEHLQFLEDKYDLKAKKATFTALLSAFGGTTMIGGAGLSYFANNAGIDITSTVSMATIGGLALGTSLVSGIIAHHQNKKTKKYRYFRQLSEAGLEDSTKLEKTREIIKGEGSFDDIKNEIMPKQHRYVGLHGDTPEVDIVEFQAPEDEDQLKFECF